MTTQTPWQQVHLPTFSKLAHDGVCDVVVVGGGMTGLTAAYFLKKAGKKVCLLERGQLAAGDTGCTTAHLTYVTDKRISELVRVFGKDSARLIWEGGAAALNTIEQVINRAKIQCDFRRVPGFLHSPLEGESDDTKDLQADVEAVRELGFEAGFVRHVPGLNKPGIRFANQALFHPLKYLARLASGIEGKGCTIHENSEVTEVQDGPLGVVANGKTIKCDFVVIATHVPLQGKAGLVAATLLQTKLAPYTSYAIGAKIPSHALPEASFWDTSDPYHYLRVEQHERGAYAILGGEDHKTGQQGDSIERCNRLERLLKQIVPEAHVDARWSGQVIETNDGLPYIGTIAERQFVATGFSGNGMTFGTLAGMMACDAVVGRKSPWQEIFDVNRTKLLGGAWDFIKENLDYPYYLVCDRLLKSDAASTRAVRRGKGKILKLDGERVACSRDEKGELSKVSAICTHLGCIVHWNAAEHTWDCPCHGS